MAAGICEAAFGNDPKTTGVAGFDASKRVAKRDQLPSGTLPISLDCLAPHGSSNTPVTLAVATDLLLPPVHGVVALAFPEWPPASRDHIDLAAARPFDQPQDRAETHDAVAIEVTCARKKNTAHSKVNTATSLPTFSNAGSTRHVRMKNG